MFLTLGSSRAAAGIMVTLLIQTFGVSRIKSVPLPGQNQLMLRLHLIRVISARCMRDTHSQVVHVEHEVVLTHQCASDQHLASILYINRDAVAACLLSIQVFARVPIDSCLLGFVAQEEPQDGEAAEVVVGAVGELLLAVAEAKVAPAREVHLPLAVVLRIERTKPLQVQLDRIVALRVHVCEGRAGVNESGGMRLTTIHQMIVQHDSAETHFEVIIRVQDFNPFDIIIW